MRFFTESTVGKVRGVRVHKVVSRVTIIMFLELISHLEFLNHRFLLIPIAMLFNPTELLSQTGGSCEEQEKNVVVPTTAKDNGVDFAPAI